MFELKEVSFQYPGSGQGTPALNRICLTLGPEKTLAIVGMSGSGKTSLIKVMAGLLKPTEGQVLYEGRPLEAPHPDISVIFQDFGLLPWKTVKENILLPLKIKGERTDAARLAPVLERLGIEGLLQAFPGQLSGGEKQRVAIARALASSARVLLMDEPFSSLDIVNREGLQRFMMELFHEKRLGAVVVTHDIEEALLMGDEVAVFDPEGGCIAQMLDNTGHREENYAQSETYVQRMLEIKRTLKGRGASG